MSSNKKSIIDFPKDYTVIDLETTGFSQTFDSILEIAAIRYRNDNMVDHFHTLINPGFEIPSHITSLTGIKNKDVESAPKIEDVINEYLDFVGNDIIIGHNVGFDIGFLKSNSSRPIENNYVNTLRISHKANPELESHSLSLLIGKYNISSELHRALYDCEATAKVYQLMKKDVLSKMTIEECRDMFKKGNCSKCKISESTTDKTEFDEDNFFFNKKVVFTGKLEKYSRKEAIQVITDFGGKGVGSVSAQTDVLVVGDMDYSASIQGRITSKHKKATELQKEGSGIIIMSETDFYNIVNE